MDLKWIEEGAKDHWTLIDRERARIIVRVYQDRTRRGWFFRRWLGNDFHPGGEWVLHPALFASAEEAKAVAMAVVRMGV